MAEAEIEKRKPLAGEDEMKITPPPGAGPTASFKEMSGLDTIAIARTAILTNPHLSRKDKDDLIVKLKGPSGRHFDLDGGLLRKIPPSLYDGVLNDISRGLEQPELTDEQKIAVLNKIKARRSGLPDELAMIAELIGVGDEVRNKWIDRIKAAKTDVEFFRTVKDIRGELHRERRRLMQLDKSKQEMRARSERCNDALAEIKAWASIAPQLQRPESSTFLKLRSSFDTDEVYIPSMLEQRGEQMLEFMSEVWEEAELFVVEHDWARAFEKAQDYIGGNFTLPHPHCIFEFRVSGRQIVVTAFLNRDEGEVMMMLPMIRAKAGWYVCGSICMMSDGRLGAWKGGAPLKVFDGKTTEVIGFAKTEKPSIEEIAGRFIEIDKSDVLRPLYEVLGNQIRAVSIALEAEVAAKEIVRIPHRSNQPPRTDRRAPLGYSYHVVSLAHRHRVALRTDPDAEPANRKRLHFRRGHYRHYQTYKVWINWTLVGNPDLGWVDKHYKL